MDLKHGSANVTWIIRWESMEKRNQGPIDVFGSEGWLEIWSMYSSQDSF